MRRTLALRPDKPVSAGRGQYSRRAVVGGGDPLELVAGDLGVASDSAASGGNLAALPDAQLSGAGTDNERDPAEGAHFLRVMGFP